MRKTKRELFIPFHKRTEVQTELSDQTIYTDQLYTTDRASLMKNIELGFPEPTIKFLNGRSMQSSSLIENIEEAVLTTNLNIDLTLSDTQKNIDSVTTELKREESPAGEGVGPI